RLTVPVRGSIGSVTATPVMLPGVVVAPDKLLPGRGDYAPGTLVTLRPDPDHLVGAWTGCDASTPMECAVTMTSARTVSPMLVARPPVILSINPASGRAAGGTGIAIEGGNFRPGATVKIGGALAAEVVVASGTRITAKTPPGTAGPQEVVVTNADGTAATKS